MVLPKAEGWFAVDSIDLTGVGSVNLMAGWQTPPEYGFDFEIRLDAPDGKSLGSAAFESARQRATICDRTCSVASCNRRSISYDVCGLETEKCGGKSDGRHCVYTVQCKIISRGLFQLVGTCPYYSSLCVDIVDQQDKDQNNEAEKFS